MQRLNNILKSNLKGKYIGTFSATLKGTLN